jgi:xylulokinase
MLFWLTNTRDPNHIFYDPSLIKKVQVDPDKLPPLKSSIEVLGELSTEAAASLGLPQTVKVVMGSPDHQSACIGSGAVRDFEGHLYVGTSSWIQCVVPFKKTDVLHSIASLPTAIPGKYYCVNEQDIAGGALAFLVERILFPQNQLRPESPPEDVYRWLDKLAAQAPAGSGKLIFTPWLNGERTPVDDTTVRAGLYNLSLTTTPEQIARAFFEGVAYNNRWALGYVEKFIGRRLDPLNLIGGGAKSEVWCQIFADVLDRTVRQVQDPIWANARGAAWIAAVALGYITWAEIPELIQYTKVFKPEPARRQLYDELFAEFLHIYRNNRAMYLRLNRVRSARQSRNQRKERKTQISPMRKRD